MRELAPYTMRLTFPSERGETAVLVGPVDQEGNDSVSGTVGRSLPIVSGLLPCSFAAQCSPLRLSWC